MNYAKTALLLLVLTAIFVAMGAVVGGQAGMLIAFVLALAMNAWSLWNSDKLVLRMFRAVEVDERSAPEYYALVRSLAERAELPMPRVYVINNPQPNAFATGATPERAAVAASTGLLDVLTRQELAGVIAHELAHIKNRDTLTMGVAATIGGAISMLAQYLQFGLLFGSNRENGSGPGFLVTLITMLAAPIAASMVQMAISRSREYQADRLGAMICGEPMWLASALAKINAAARRVVNRQAEAVPATAHLFIINPLNGQGVDNWFSTHPSTENRIAALQELARELGQPAGRAEMSEWIGNDGAAGIDTGAAGPWTERPAMRQRRGPWG
ncbi:MAG: zinc metalloprotease HtpX [Hyphomicrobium sp.]|nr:zinc metalloprotease HtpX [Hyphomicrobium sp.]